jgi:uncharacterized protein YjiS (DUF1127 family)
MKFIITNIAKKMQKMERYRKTVRELSLLNDRDLSDIGITRCDIPRIANESVNNRDFVRG